MNLDFLKDIKDLIKNLFFFYFVGPPICNRREFQFPNFRLDAFSHFLSKRNVQDLQFFFFVEVIIKFDMNMTILVGVKTSTHSSTWTS
jgi:hypothetical protein